MTIKLPEPYDTIASLVERINAHTKMLGGQGIDFVAAALVRTLVLQIVQQDNRMTDASVEPLCQMIGVGLPDTVQRSMVPPPVIARDITETDR